MLKLPMKCLKLVFDAQNIIFLLLEMFSRYASSIFFSKNFWDLSPQRKEAKKRKKLGKCPFFDIKLAINQKKIR